MPAKAQEHSVLDRAVLRVGSYVVSGNSTLQVDGRQGELGTRLDLEETLGLEDSDTVLDLSATFRLGRRHQLGLSYYDVSRSGSRAVDQEIRFGDTVYAVDATLDSSFDTRVVGFTYTFFPVARDRFALGLGLGVDYLSVEASVSGRLAVVGGGGGVQLEATESASDDLPIPLVRLELRYGILPRLLLLSEVAYLDVNELEDWSGTALDLSVALEHRTFRNLGFGVSYSLLDIDAETQAQRLTGAVDLRNDGFLLYLRLGR